MYSTPAQVRLALAPAPPSNTAPPQDTAASFSDEQLIDAIMEADSKINLALSARYATPVAPLDANADPLVYPDPISYWSRDIAAYLATLTKARNRPVVATEPVYLRMQAAVTEMNAVRDGKAVLSIAVADSPSAEGGFAGVVDDCGPVFGPSNWGYPPASGLVSYGADEYPPWGVLNGG